jgi:hypothetical protein
VGLGLFRLPSNRRARVALILLYGLFAGVFLWRNLVLPAFIGCVVVVACAVVWKWRST